MSTITLTTSRRPSLAWRVADALYRLAVRAYRAHLARREIKALLHVERYLLADIGITRGDVLAALSTPLPDDPGGRLAELAMERREAALASARDRARVRWRLPDNRDAA